MGLYFFSSVKKRLIRVKNYNEVAVVHCKFLPHENYGDWEWRGPSRENLHYIYMEKNMNFQSIN